MAVEDKTTIGEYWGFIALAICCNMAVVYGGAGLALGLKKKGISQYFMECCNAAAAGLFLAIAFWHILPEVLCELMTTIVKGGAREWSAKYGGDKFEEWKDLSLEHMIENAPSFLNGEDEHNIEEKFQIIGALLFVGYCVILFFERVFVHIFLKDGGGHNHGHSHGIVPATNPMENHGCSSHGHSHGGHSHSLEEDHDHHRHEGEARDSGTSTEHGHGHSHGHFHEKDDCPLGHGHSHQHSECGHGHSHSHGVVVVGHSQSQNNSPELNNDHTSRSRSQSHVHSHHGHSHHGLNNDHEAKDHHGAVKRRSHASSIESNFPVKDGHGHGHSDQHDNTGNTHGHGHSHGHSHGGGCEGHTHGVPQNAGLVTSIFLLLALSIHGFTEGYVCGGVFSVKGGRTETWTKAGFFLLSLVIHKWIEGFVVAMSILKNYESEEIEDREQDSQQSNLQKQTLAIVDGTPVSEIAIIEEEIGIIEEINDRNIEKERQTKEMYCRFWSFTTICAFASPLGTTLNVVLKASLSGSAFSMISPYVNGVAVGTLLYVAVTEIVPEVFVDHGKFRKSLLKYVLMVFFGSILMVILNALPHSHGDGDEEEETSNKNLAAHIEMVSSSASGLGYTAKTGDELKNFGDNSGFGNISDNFGNSSGMYGFLAIDSSDSKNVVNDSNSDEEETKKSVEHDNCDDMEDGSQNSKTNKKQEAVVGCKDGCGCSHSVNPKKDHPALYYMIKEAVRLETTIDERERTINTLLEHQQKTEEHVKGREAYIKEVEEAVRTAEKAVKETTKIAEEKRIKMEQHMVGREAYIKELESRLKAAEDNRVKLDAFHADYKKKCDGYKQECETYKFEMDSYKAGMEKFKLEMGSYKRGMEKFKLEAADHIQKRDAYIVKQNAYIAKQDGYIKSVEESRRRAQNIDKLSAEEGGSVDIQSSQIHQPETPSQNGDRSANTENGDRSGNTQNGDRSGNTENGDRSGSTQNGDQSGNTENGDRSGNTQNGDHSGNTESDDRSGNTEKRQTQKDNFEDKIASDLSPSERDSKGLSFKRRDSPSSDLSSPPSGLSASAKSRDLNSGMGSPSPTASLTYNEDTMEVPLWSLLDTCIYHAGSLCKIFGLPERRDLLPLPNDVTSSPNAFSSRPSDLTPSPHDSRPSSRDSRPSPHDSRPSPHDLTPSPHDSRPSPHDSRPSNLSASAESRDLNSGIRSPTVSVTYNGETREAPLTELIDVCRILTLPPCEIFGSSESRDSPSSDSIPSPNVVTSSPNAFSSPPNDLKPSPSDLSACAQSRDLISGIGSRSPPVTPAFEGIIRLETVRSLLEEAPPAFEPSGRDFEAPAAPAPLTLVEAPILPKFDALPTFDVSAEPKGSMPEEKWSRFDGKWFMPEGVGCVIPPTGSSRVEPSSLTRFSTTDSSSHGGPRSFSDSAMTGDEIPVCKSFVPRTSTGWASATLPAMPKAPMICKPCGVGGKKKFGSLFKCCADGCCPPTFDFSGTSSHSKE